MPLDANEIAQRAQTALLDMKANNIVVLPITEISSIADFMLIASGTSTRHVKSIANSVALEMKQAEVQPLGIEGEDAGEWVLVDLGSVIVHVMLPSTREFYDLEKLWSMRPSQAASGDE